MATLAPWIVFWRMSSIAEGLPDISSATSKPSVIPNSAWMSARSSERMSTARVAPIRFARSSRNGLTSVMTTFRAPACTTTGIAISPIGPAPVINTSSPKTGNSRAVWTAFPNGSNRAAISGSKPS